MEPILKLEHIQKYYGNEGNITKAIRDISFSVEAGEFLGIMGASGSGKTTLLNCISTIDTVSAGHIYLGGTDVTEIKPKAIARFRRENLGFVFQDFNLLDTLTISENIALALSINKTPARDVEPRIQDIAQKLNITDILNKYPYQVSGGQKQRCACARAIINNPKLLLADEPTGALDSHSAQMLLSTIQSINEQLSATILMVTFSLYLPSKDDFHNRMKYDFPVVAISLSDYNTIRKMLGYEPITLSEGEFTTQWQSIATNEERDSFLKEHSSILTDAGELTLSEHSFYEEAIGETAYNSYTDVLYVFPDSICENLLSVIRNRYIMTTESISYENARTLEQAFSAEYPEITDTGVSYAIRLSTLQVNTTKASNFVLQASMLYAAVVLMVICLTVLSLQQLLDASQYKYRFSVLRKLGVEDTHIGKLVLKQLGIWFGLPIVVAIIVSTMVIIYFIQTISAEISAYIGFGALMSQIGTTVSILALLLICYFISTWLLFKKSIK